jgi:hypothetical protein
MISAPATTGNAGSVAVVGPPTLREVIEALLLMPQKAQLFSREQSFQS